MKKITALVLALIMTLSLLPMTVWAEGEQQLYAFKGGSFDDPNAWATTMRTNKTNILSFCVSSTTSNEGRLLRTDNWPITVSADIGSVTWHDTYDELVWDASTATAESGYIDVTVTKNSTSTTYRLNVTVDLGSGGDQGDENDGGTLYYRDQRAQYWSNQRIYKCAGGNSVYHLATDASGTALANNNTWTATVSEGLGRVTMIAGVLYWDHSQTVPDTSGVITVSNGKTGSDAVVYTIPVTMIPPEVVVFNGQNMLIPDVNDDYWYPVSAASATVIDIVLRDANMTLKTVSASNDGVDVVITPATSSYPAYATLTIPNNLSETLKVRVEITSGGDSWEQELWFKSAATRVNWQQGAAITSNTTFVEWTLQEDGPLYENADEPVPFTLTVDGKPQTFYMMPVIVNDGVPTPAWSNFRTFVSYRNSADAYYAIDFWTSTDGGETLTEISNDLRDEINAMVDPENTSITIAPVAGYTGVWGTRFPSYVTGEGIPKHIQEILGNRLCQIGYIDDLDSLGMWQVKATVKFKNDGPTLTSLLSTSGQYALAIQKRMDSADVADVNEYIASFAANYSDAELAGMQLILELPAEEFDGLIVVPEKAPGIVQIIGSTEGGNETVLNGGICANNNGTDVINIRLVGAGKNGGGNSSNKTKWDANESNGLGNTENYGIYGSAYGYISNCSFTGYDVAVHSTSASFRFGIGNSIFYENNTALYVNADTTISGTHIPTMQKNVFLSNGCALSLQKFPTKLDMGSLGTAKNIFIDNDQDISRAGRSFFAPNNAFGTLLSNGKDTPKVTGKTYAAPYYGITAACKTAMSDPSALSLSAVENQINNWIGTVKKYPKNWAVPSYGSIDSYVIAVADIENDMTISTIDNSANGTDDVVAIITLKKNNA